MNVEEQIQNYLASQPETKRKEMQELHTFIKTIMPEAKLWFLDGKDENSNVISNPNIGYGTHIIKYKDGKSKEFYKVGISANTTGISIYLFGIEDKKFLSETFGKTIGKASISSYCIKFKTLKDIHMNVLEKAIQYVNKI